MNRFSSIFLNANIPWVGSSEDNNHKEENWLHNSTLETHIPLLEALTSLKEKDVKFNLVINLSPTLLEMWSNDNLKERTVSYIDNIISLCKSEIKRTKNTKLDKLSEKYLSNFSRLKDVFVNDWDGDIIKVYNELYQSNHIELTATSATYALLPLLSRPIESAQAQIRLGIRQFVKAFKKMPKGFWLPESAYSPTVANLLKREGIQWTIIEQHAFNDSKKEDHFNPRKTINEELVVFTRDQESSNQVWSADEGYPGNENYRSFMRDVGIEENKEYVSKHINRPDFTGIKYYRLKKEEAEKEEAEKDDVYDFQLALFSAKEDAMSFVNSRGAQLSNIESKGVKSPIIISGFDADLFGHWWYEGITFLKNVLCEIDKRDDFSLISPSFYLETQKNNIEISSDSPVSSSWGENGYFETWTNKKNNWIQVELQYRAERLVKILKYFNSIKSDGSITSYQIKCIQIMTKELMLAQSSDWSFLILSEPSKEYAENRIKGHIKNFDQIWSIIRSEENTQLINKIDELNPIFLDLPWSLYEPYS